MSAALVVIQTWAAVVWADGKVTESEYRVMKQFIESSPDLGEDEREVALGYLERPVRMDVAALDQLHEEDREATYRIAAKLAIVDGEHSPAEAALLERLRDALGVEPERARLIEKAFLALIRR